MPRISVVIPVYGVEKYIERCAKSLFEQTLTDIEFIFIDDCTPDNSISILKDIIEEYRLRLSVDKKEVRIVRMLTNSGQAAVRKRGIQLCHGDYIIHCDSDDWVDVSIYEKLYKMAIQENADVVVCDAFVSEPNKQWHYEQPVGENGYSCIDLCLTHKMPAWLWNKLVRRSLFDESIEYPSGNMLEDFALMIQIFQKADKVCHIKEPLYYYFQNPSSISNDNVNYEKGLRWVKSIKSNIDIVLNHLDYSQFEEGLDCNVRMIARRSFDYMDDDEVWEYLKHTELEHFSLFQRIYVVLVKIHIVPRTILRIIKFKN